MPRRRLRDNAVCEHWRARADRMHGGAGTQGGGRCAAAPGSAVHAAVRREQQRCCELEPESANKWNEKLGRDDLVWKKVWQQKSMYTSPRDKTQIMRLQRRNLWLAQHRGHSGCDHTTCAAKRCRQQESQLHLIECPIINRGFWEPLCQHINSLGLRQAENTPTFWITGTLGSGEQTDSESWAMVTWAWRSLYACTTKTHLEGVKLNLKVRQRDHHTRRIVVSKP